MPGSPPSLTGLKTKDEQLLQVLSRCRVDYEMALTDDVHELHASSRAHGAPARVQDQERSFKHNGN